MDWYKQYRDILESDIIHIASKRPDGRSPDWILHANPTLQHKALWIGYNPLKTNVEMDLTLNVYYTGLNKSLVLIPEGNREQKKVISINGNHQINVPVKWKAGEIRWFSMEALENDQ